MVLGLISQSFVRQAGNSGFCVTVLRQNSFLPSLVQLVVFAGNPWQSLASRNASLPISASLVIWLSFPRVSLFSCGGFLF